MRGDKKLRERERERKVICSLTLAAEHSSLLPPHFRFRFVLSPSIHKYFQYIVISARFCLFCFFPGYTYSISSDVRAKRVGTSPRISAPSLSSCVSNTGPIHIYLDEENYRQVHVLVRTYPIVCTYYTRLKWCTTSFTSDIQRNDVIMLYFIKIDYNWLPDYEKLPIVRKKR